jgi:hypothetical protein
MTTRYQPNFSGDQRFCLVVEARAGLVSLRGTSASVSIKEPHFEGSHKEPIMSTFLCRTRSLRYGSINPDPSLLARNLTRGGQHTSILNRTAKVKDLYCTIIISEVIFAVRPPSCARMLLLDRFLRGYSVLVLAFLWILYNDHERYTNQARKKLRWADYKGIPGIACSSRINCYR